MRRNKAVEELTTKAATVLGSELGYGGVTVAPEEADWVVHAGGARGTVRVRHRSKTKAIRAAHAALEALS